MEKALKTLPSSEIKAYDQVMTRIGEAGSHTSVTAVRILTWIFHAARPLRMDELLEAVHVEEEISGLRGDGKFVAADIIEMCHGLVVHEESSGLVRFIHFTVHEFLKSLNLPVMNIVKTCLAYLEHNAFDNVCSDNESMENRVQTFGFCLYAAQFWGFHVRGKTEILPCVQQAIFRLLASENRRNSILQMARYAESKWNRLSFARNQSLLHIAAKNGLSIICQHFLHKQPKYALYISVLNETDQ